MGIVIAKHPYLSVSTNDTLNDFSSINIGSYESNNGVSLVYEHGVHRQHFRRMLEPTSTRGVAVGRDAKKISASARRSTY